MLCRFAAHDQLYIQPVMPAKRAHLRSLASRARRWLNDFDSNVKSIRQIRRIIDHFNSSTQGAAYRDKTGHCIELQPPPLDSSNGHGYVYVILHQDIECGVYVGWTTQSLQERFWEHWSGMREGQSTRARTLCREMHKYGLHKFVILAIEQVAFTAPQDVAAGAVAPHRTREQFWQSRFGSLVGDGGYNDIRVIRQKSRPMTTRTAPRIFNQRAYDLKAAHLLQYWINGGEQLAGAHFANYGDTKLLHFVEVWSMAAPSTPAHRLCKVLLSVLVDRTVRAGAAAAAARQQQQQQQQARSVIFPFSSYLWDQFPLARMLDDPRRRELLPAGSELREHVFAVRLKYTRPLKLLACNYSAVPQIYTAYCAKALLSEASFWKLVLQLRVF